MSRALSSQPAILAPGDLRAKRHLLFDLDGTLVDSSAAHERAYREALAGHSAAMAAAFDYEAAKGKRTVEVLRDAGIEEPELSRLVAAKQAAYLANVARGDVALFPGARPLLEHLAATARGIFLATGASRRSTDQVLRRCGIDAFFQATVTADDVLRGKPSGDCFELLVKKWRLAPGDCLVVEDAESGVAAAHAAGLQAAVVHSPAVRSGDASFSNLEALRVALGGAP
ncbi:MAG TPA: HAD family phosphatase [Myxococcales bacterium]|nr:HAD family phosphatase [Myxococcales bacterium]